MLELIEEGEGNYSETFDGADDLIPHHLCWVTFEIELNGVRTLKTVLDFDICDIRTICLGCGNGTDCCTCESF